MRNKMIGNILSIVIIVIFLSLIIINLFIDENLLNNYFHVSRPVIFGIILFLLSLILIVSYCYPSFGFLFRAAKDALIRQFGEQYLKYWVIFWFLFFALWGVIVVVKFN